MPDSNRVFTLISEPSEFIAGDTVVLNYKALKEDGIIDLLLVGTTIKWTMAYWGNPDLPVLQATYKRYINNSSVEVIETNGITVSYDSSDEFTVTLTPNQTSALSGQYVYQIEITDFNERTSRRIQGSIVFWPMVHSL